MKHTSSNVQESKIILKDAFFKDYADLIYIPGFTRYAISERLKIAIGDAKITPSLIQPKELINFHFHNGTP